MDCKIHNKPYQYVCRSPNCQTAVLCYDCRKAHLSSSAIDRNVHIASILSIKQACQEANRNLTKNYRSLQQLIAPFTNQSLINTRISEQKSKLNKERQSLINQINELFDKQIQDMEKNNKKSLSANKSSIPTGQIQQKLKRIKELKSNFATNQASLLQSLSYSEQQYINNIRKKNNILSSMKMQVNQYYAYDEDAKHDFYISRLQLKRKTINNKLLQKVQNESNLYFLIADYKQGKYLHYFSPTQKLLRIYDIQMNNWKQIVCKQDLPSYGATVFDYKTGTFYLIGGEQKGAKSNKIICYSKQKNWQKFNMKKAVSSPMATVIYDRSDNFYILIAGGIGQDKKHSKDCFIFYPDKNIFYDASPLNFGVSSGTLVTFNNQVVFRIGGLGHFNPTSASICQIAQKCNFTKFVQECSNPYFNPESIKQYKWTYMDIEVHSTEPTRKFNLFYAHQAAIQINPNEIFVFGGMSHNNSGVRQAYILQVESIVNKQNSKSYRYYARWINQKPLISAQAFIGLRPIIYNKKVMSLQNISYGNNEYYQKQKRLIEFNMYDWREIENIVN